MRRVVLLATLALALPLAALADSSIDISNADGTITGSSSGLSLTGSTLFKYGTWTLVTLGNGTHSYTLIGAAVSTNGSVTATVQITVNTGKGFFPEPWGSWAQAWSA